MKIRKALITLADPNQRSLPLQTLIDQEGRRRNAIELVLQEALSAGAEELILVVCPGDQDPYLKAAGELAQNIRFIEQPKPTGYAQAILGARSAIGDEPFLHLVGDHLCVANSNESCASQVVAAAEANEASISGVQATREGQIRSFGAVGGRLVDRSAGLYQIEKVLEKPTPTEAELSILVPGLRSGFFLCFFGIHALQPSIFDILEETTQLDSPEGRSLSTALDRLSQREKLLALEVDGSRYDIGSDYGLLFSQLSLSLSGKDSERILSGIVEMLATRRKD